MDVIDSVAGYAFSPGRSGGIAMEWAYGEPG